MSELFLCTGSFEIWEAQFTWQGTGRPGSVLPLKNELAIVRMQVEQNNF
jgi:hypothetical protein